MFPSPSLILAVAAGGAVGSVIRFVALGWIGRLLGAGFPFGTLLVNASGCFVMGVAAESATLFWSPSPELRAFVFVGVLGGYTTFSSFALDVGTLSGRGETSPAMTYVLASVILTLAGFYMGMRLVRWFAGSPL